MNVLQKIIDTYQLLWHIIGMDLAELAKHDIIAIDLDGTLIGHSRSHLLQEFILKNYKKKKFHIITFRSHGLERDIAADLNESTRLTGVRLRLDHFAGIHNVAETLYEQRLKDPDSYWGWKAQKCRDIGCTIIIDDMEDAIKTYCAQMGIVCINPTPPSRTVGRQSEIF